MFVQSLKSNLLHHPWIENEYVLCVWLLQVPNNQIRYEAVHNVQFFFSARVIFARVTRRNNLTLTPWYVDKSCTH
jgi:hypothetical protein